MKSNSEQTLKFQYASDLHFEIWTPSHPFEEFITPPAESEKESTYLILAGDLAPLHHNRLREFLKWCSPRFNTIFYVSGNHEYYFKGKFTIPEMVEMKRKLCKECGDNIIPLENETYFIENTEQSKKLIIIGSTMWSYIPPHYSEPIYKRINDFRQIADFDILRQNEIYTESIEFIETCLDNEEYKDFTKIVVTHHAPLPPEYTISEIYQGDPTNHAFATDLESIVQKADVWIYGHTHFSVTNVVRKCKTDVEESLNECFSECCLVTANCRGHPNEKYNDYDPAKKIYLN